MRVDSLYISLSYHPIAKISRVIGHDSRCLSSTYDRGTPTTEVIEQTIVEYNLIVALKGHEGVVRILLEREDINPNLADDSWGWHE